MDGGNIQIQLLLKLNFMPGILQGLTNDSNTTLVKVKLNQTLAEAEKIMLFKYNSC